MAQIFEEQQYLNLLAQVFKFGQKREDRTGTGTISIFAPNQLRFSLSRDHKPDQSQSQSNGIPNGSEKTIEDPYDLILPLLTTKRVFLRGVLLELLWFITGQTSSIPLSSQGVHIWDSNSTRTFLDARGLGHYEEGDLGPVYGFQWRHFGAEYEGWKGDYEGKGVDQLEEVRRMIIEDPWSRRIILSAWNPADLPKMALPPCHMFCQFYVSSPPPSSPSRKNLLSCILYMRSSDLGLGLPFNIASYALLTQFIAITTNTRPHELVVQLGDAHVYLNHIEPLLKQVKREIKSDFPIVKIKGWEGKKWEEWKEEDVEVIGYEPQKGIKMEMAV